MNHKLAGIIFLIFGIGVVADASMDLFGSPSVINVKNILLLLLGAASCIYGVKRFQGHGVPKSSKEDK